MGKVSDITAEEERQNRNERNEHERSNTTTLNRREQTYNVPKGKML